jgi:hypothetical protein
MQCRIIDSISALVFLGGWLEVMLVITLEVDMTCNRTNMAVCRIFGSFYFAFNCGDWNIF